MLDKRMGNQNIAREKKKLSAPTYPGGREVLAAVPSAAMAGPNRAMGSAINTAQRVIPAVGNTLFPQVQQAKRLTNAVSSGAGKVFSRLSNDINDRRVAAGTKVNPVVALPTQNFTTNLQAATSSANTAANASNQAALAKQYPNGRLVGGNSPSPALPAAPSPPVQQQRPTPGPGQHSTAVFSQQPGNNNQIIRHHDQIRDNQQPRLSGSRNPKMNGTMRAGQGGTMDVTFDQSTPQAARQAFMTDPVKPVGQMAQYDRTVQAEADRQEAAKKTAGPELLTPENSTMGWKSRLAANDQIMANWRQQQQDQTQLTVAREGNDNQLENTRLSGTISGQNQLATQGLQNSGQLNNTALSTKGRLAEIDRTGAIDTQQIAQQGDIAAQAETRRLAADAILKGADPAAVQKGIMNTQGGATPDVTGIDIPQATEAESYTYHAPQQYASGNVIQGTGGFAAKRTPRLIPLDAAEPGQPMPQEIQEAQPGGVVATPEQALGNDPVRVQQFNTHLQKLKALRTPEEAGAYLDSLQQPDQYGVVDSAMYSLLMREIMGGQ